MVDLSSSFSVNVYQRVLAEATKNGDQKCRWFHGFFLPSTNVGTKGWTGLSPANSENANWTNWTRENDGSKCSKCSNREFLWIFPSKMGSWPTSGIKKWWFNPGSELSEPTKNVDLTKKNERFINKCDFMEWNGHQWTITNKIAAQPAKTGIEMVGIDLGEAVVDEIHLPKLGLKNQKW